MWDPGVVVGFYNPRDPVFLDSQASFTSFENQPVFSELTSSPSFLAESRVVQVAASLILGLRCLTQLTPVPTLGRVDTPYCSDSS